MFGRVSKEKVVANVRSALDSLSLKFDEQEDGNIVLGAMGDDNPIGMVIVTDDDHKTLNIYCYLMFDIPEDARAKLIPELNTVNNTINNGGFYMADGEPKIYFKIVQSYYDRVPSTQMIAHLLTVAFKTVDINDGRLKDLIPASAFRKDPMFS
ncbi:MAG TPA: YbjN domain-containing protein [Euryarchaeota archaeon]|nr:YbjN domain-containing protein [Euryarchaeota archaeon]